MRTPRSVDPATQDAAALAWHNARPPRAAARHHAPSARIRKHLPKSHHAPKAHTLARDARLELRRLRPRPHEHAYSARARARARARAPAPSTYKLGEEHVD